jgi:heme/copper-type cytochrome/quinol oxidase subunit 2
VKIALKIRWVLKSLKMAAMAATSVAVIIILIVIVVLWTIVAFGRRHNDDTEWAARDGWKLWLIVIVEIIIAIMLAQGAIFADHHHHKHKHHAHHHGQATLI